MYAFLFIFNQLKTNILIVKPDRNLRMR